MPMQVPLAGGTQCCGLTCLLLREIVPDYDIPPTLDCHTIPFLVPNLVSLLPILWMQSYIYALVLRLKGYFESELITCSCSFVGSQEEVSSASSHSAIFPIPQDLFMSVLSFHLPLYITHEQTTTRTQYGQNTATPFLPCSRSLMSTICPLISLTQIGTKVIVELRKQKCRGKTVT